MKPSARLAKLFFGVLIVAFFLVDFLDHLAPMKEVLDSNTLSLRIGDNSFSAYVFAKTIFTIIIVFWLTSIIAHFGERRITSIQGLRESNKELITKAFQTLVYFLAFVIGLDILGIDLTTLTIFSGAVGIGIGFGLQKITSNFISGLILLYEKSIENDDLVELADGTYGFVRHTGARYTLIETLECKEIMIPNEDFITSRVTNWTYNSNKGRLELTVGVSYLSDIEKARELILEAAREEPRCIMDPEPACFLREFSDSSVKFLLFFWIGDITEGRQESRSDIMRSIWRKFKENDIKIPYPQLDLHIKNPEELKGIIEAITGQVSHGPHANSEEQPLDK